MIKIHDIMKNYMKNSISTVTERGQVSIPAAIRRQAGIVAGEQLVWQCDGEGMIRVSKSPAVAVKGAMHMRGFAKHFRETLTTGQWMQELRAGEREAD
jgi:AbrB family looped-hinge helix DNA binding protein